MQLTLSRTPKAFFRLVVLSCILTSNNAISSVKLDAIPPVEHHRLAAFTYPNESVKISDVAGLADKVCRALDVEYSQCFYSIFTNKKTNSIDIEVYSFINRAVMN
ncbi:hypothetical protein JW310_19910 [Enterobacter cloacae subsp. cloacae]|uniref:hypothetical protein n=1 Tax=Enterobacter cloacae TaxID=550 RepID=UPI001C5AC388|nr:hypothetical protein [Enterobacter cloacae]ELH0000356.1 hypothetical protein [Enterobacter cloacae]MBW4198906.1 hypothetical protein [Enterobacter cloacae subsp. cloacae]